jgi:hypothetical protein
MTADIPPGIGDPNILHQRLREKADRMFARWKEDNKNLPQRLKDLFSGDTEEAGKALGKLVEKAVGEGAAGATGAVGGGGLITTLSGGHLTYHTLLGATAGFAVAVVVRTGKNVVTMKQKRKEDPFRYLTMMEKAGVSYVTSN